MSTRTRPRRHPYQRQRQPTRNRRNQRQQNMASSDPDGELELGACIDLTGNDSLDVGEVIDLTETSINQSMNDPDPVVVISPTDVDNADTFWRERRNRNVRTEGRTSRLEPIVLPSNSRESERREAVNIPAISLDDQSDEELPEVPFDVPNTSTNNSTSPLAKVTCPVCLETDYQIRQTRCLCSTVCGHIFCYTCIKQAVLAQHACPTCRKRLTLRQFHPIYL